MKKYNFFEDKLKDLKGKQQYRKLKNIKKTCGKYIFDANNRSFLDFSSNNYLGLRDDKRIIQKTKEACDKYGIGSGASRIVAGDSEIFYRFENDIAKYKNKEAAIVFNSGYDANIGVISAIMNKNDVIFCDKYNHASIYDGIALSKAKLIRYVHNDIDDLEKKLIKHRGQYEKAMIITDSVFSMDGDKAKLIEISKLKEKYNLLFMVDEAHGTGLFGEMGTGIVEEQNIKNVDIIMGTLGKSFGVQGAYIAASQVIVDYIINFSRSFIFTTAISPILIEAASEALKIMKTEKYRRDKVIANAKYIRSELKKMGYDTLDSDTQIIPVIFDSNNLALEFSKTFQENNIYLPAIRYPAVPMNLPRLRISVNYNLEDCDIKKLLKIFQKKEGKTKYEQ